MKALLATLGGFVLTLAIFLSGAAVAVWFLTAKPVEEAGLNMDQAEIWTGEPRMVDTAQQFERLPARPIAPEPKQSHEFEVEVVGKQAAELVADSEAAPVMAGNGAAEGLSPETLDTTVIASIGSMESEEKPSASAELSAVHVEWCANRYRSYRPRDNSYTPYSGGRRICVSPYTDDFSTEPSADVSPPPDAGDSYSEDTGAPSPQAEYVSADADTHAGVTQDHLSYCFSQYRSYRPEDNTYQPYGGGPRRQCR